MTIFEVAARPTFTAPVEITMPGNDDAGTPETHKVVIEFKRLRDKELTEFQRRQIPLIDALKEVIVGWRGQVDAHGATLPFSTDALDALLDISSVPLATYQAFLKHSYGAALKN